MKYLLNQFIKFSITTNDVLISLHYLLIHNILIIFLATTKILILYYRYAYSSDAVAGYITNVGKCPSTLFLCLLHLWHRGSATLGRNTETTMRTCSTAKCSSTQVRWIHHSFIPTHLLCTMRHVIFKQVSLCDRCSSL